MSYIFEKHFETSTEKLVLLSLADFANDEGICWPSIKTIASKADCDPSTVKRILNKFKGTILEKAPKNRENGSSGSNIYLFIEYIKKHEINMDDSPLYSEFSKAQVGVRREPGEGVIVTPPIEPLIKNLKRNKEKGKLTPSEIDALDTYEIFSTYPQFKETWFAFIQKREDMKKPPTHRAKVSLLNKLNKLSESCADTAIDILNQSKENSWEGLFELKTPTSKRNCDGTNETKTDWDNVNEGIIYQDGKLEE
ncbi:MAG: helix-turn-helix domain-containing protein, partial [Candidatus Pacebacteria bacterium]|nr:helix-turn-helix domain-containing protein [Candidatus Paceibacterota bacterium]